MFRLRKLGGGSEAEALMTRVGFAFRSLAYVPLLGVLVFAPPFLCSGEKCQPSDIANSGLTVSLLLGLLAAVGWVGFVFIRVYRERATKVFVDMGETSRGVLLVVVGLAIAAVLVMALSAPTSGAEDQALGGTQFLPIE